jgi:putative ABC transport system permease protein
MHIPTRWVKILKDIWGNRTRSLLVIFSIAVGVASVGMITNAGIIVKQDLFGSFAEGNPTSLEIYASPFQRDLASAVDSMREVENVQARRVERASIQDAEGSWDDLALNAFQDLADLQVNRIGLERGRISLGVREIALERQSADGLGLNIGDMATIKIEDDRTYDLEVVGIVHDLYGMPYALLGEATGYVALESLRWMGELPYYNRLDVVVAGDMYDRDHVLEVGDLIRDRVIEPSGYRVESIAIPGLSSNPGKHWGEDQINGFLLILQIMGVMAIILSSGLVVNTVSAILVQQIRQIGIMRSIGAVRRQLVGMYFFNVIMYSVIGLALALPLGLLGSWWLANFAAGFVNFDLSAVSISWQVIALQIGLGLLMPLGVAIYPILSGTRLSVYDAIYQYGIGSKSGGSWLDRGLMRVRNLAPPIVLSLRNTFRNKARLVFTLITLTLAGAMFIAVFSTRASLSQQLEDIARYLAFDAALGLPPGSKKQTVEREARRIPDVSAAEGWAQSVGVFVREDGSESGELEIVGLPYDSVTIEPLMLKGRWLEAGDSSQVIVNDDLLDEETEIVLGGEITLKVGNRERTYQVVGVTSKHLSGPRIYMEYGSFGQLTNRPNQVDTIRIRRDLEAISSSADQDEIASQLETRFDHANLSNSKSITRHAIFGDFTEVFDLILVVLMIMAGLLALVGGLGLTGTLGINVLERTREIGVLRAVGASNFSVRQVIVIEGIVVGLVSWTLGALLSGPSGRALAAAVVNAVMKADLNYQYSFAGLFFWLLVVGVIAVVSSLAPARRAAQLTVREVLDYE